MNATTGRRLSGGIQTAWTLVLAMLLIATAWSLSGQLQRWGMPDYLAWPLSVMFDAGGLICAAYARRAIERGTPAAMARLSLLGFVAVSGVLNWHHGQTIGGTPAAAGFGSLSAAVELLFELHRRDIRDEQRAARGLIAERMPHIPLLGWVMYPGRSWQTLRAAVGTRLDLLDPLQRNRVLPGPDTSSGPDTRADTTVRAGVRTARHTLPNADHDTLVRYLSGVGIATDTDTVRDILGEDTRPKDNEDSRSHPVRPSVVRDIRPPGQSITKSVETALASGITDKDRVLSYVRDTHGQDVKEATVSRLINRILEGKSA